MVAVVASSGALPLVNAKAGETIDLGNGATFTIGAGIRASVSADSAFAPGAGFALGGDGYSTIARFNLDNLRIYTGLSLNDYIKATVNTDRGPGGSPPQILDAYLQFEPLKEVNIWIGQMLPPSDRANLDGPFYLSEWYYPGVVSQYPSRFEGRDIGATIWGKVFDQKLVYSVGMFNGHDTTLGLFNQNQSPLFAGRVAYNFWDPEPNPAYYESSSYYGKVDVLTLGIAGMYEADGIATPVRAANYGGWNIDALMEKKLGDYGVVTLEGAFYDYNTGGINDVPGGFNNAGLTANVGGVAQGTGYLASGAYLIPVTVGWGQFQPYVRYQEFTATISNTSAAQFDAGVNYVIKAHNAVITLDYASNTASYTKSSYRWVLGLQFQL
jgi:hypothetical protein